MPVGKPTPQTIATKKYEKKAWLECQNLIIKKRSSRRICESIVKKKASARQAS